MDEEQALAVDLRGNVMTCQNVSSLEMSKNGESHHGGTLEDYDNVSIKSSTLALHLKTISALQILYSCKIDLIRSSSRSQSTIFDIAIPPLGFN